MEGRESMEQLRNPRRSTRAEEGLRGPAPFGAGSSENAALEDEGTVTVIWGANMDELPAAGLTIDELRSQLGSAYNIAPDAEVNVNGVTARGDTRVRSGDSVEFVRAAGEKGAA
jgi:hypothetical protein